MKILILIISIFSFLSLNTYASDLDEVKVRVNQLQTIDSWLPSVSEQKWIIGTILSLIFNSSGKIKSEFIDVVNTVWQQVGSDIYYDEGSVWIGTSSPSQKLDVNGWNIRSNGEFISTSANSFRSIYWNYWTIWRNDGNYYHLLFTNSWNQYWGFNSLRPFSVNMTNGNVGIGTDSPSVRLDVNGNIIADDPTVSNHVATKSYVDTQIASAWSSAISAVIDAIYPIGAVYISTSSANPGTFLWGTWVSFWAWRVLVGRDATQTEFDTIEETGGAKTHTLTVNEMPSHTHWLTRANDDATRSWGGAWFWLATSFWWDVPEYTETNDYDMISSAWWNLSHNNLQPYIVVYMWKRTW